MKNKTFTISRSEGRGSYLVLVKSLSLQDAIGWIKNISKMNNYSLVDCYRNEYGLLFYILSGDSGSLKRFCISEEGVV
jgi:hypothetical protein